MCSESFSILKIFHTEHYPKRNSFKSVPMMTLNFLFFSISIRTTLIYIETHIKTKLSYIGNSKYMK